MWIIAVHHEHSPPFEEKQECCGGVRDESSVGYKRGSWHESIATLMILSYLNAQKTERARKAHHGAPKAEPEVGRWGWSGVNPSRDAKSRD
jgi:hypothetical protein